jgi:hypothetical protein
MKNLRRCSAVMVGLSMLGVVAGCVVGAEAPIDEPGPHLGEVHQLLADEEINGRSIVGAVFESATYVPEGATEYFSVGTTGVRGLTRTIETIAFTGGASLKPSPINPNLVGLILSSGDVRLKIASVRPDGAITHYGLDASVAGGPFTRACDDAIPLYGVVGRNGEHRGTPGHITFACSDGAEHKCARFGYPPGLPGSPLWGVHQACVQGVIADYCGEGRSNTRIGTSIRFTDNAGVYQVAPGTQLPVMTAASWPPSADEYYFEAAFEASHTTAVCSARARWPLITDSCIAAIPDCPNDTVDNLIDPGGATLFIASMYNQLRLDRWRSNEGNDADRVSTVRGYFNAGDAAMMPPWPGYVHDGNDGMLLRVPPTSVPLGNLIAVSMFRSSSGDSFVARSDDARFTVSATAFTNLGQEGYVYKYQSDVPNGRELRLYRHRTNGDRTATTGAPADLAVQGYDPLIDPATGNNLIGYMAGLQ